MTVLLQLDFSPSSTEGIDASKGISCFHCAGKPGQATWCERGANKSGVKKCPGDSLNPSNTCFKAVNKVTGGGFSIW